VLLENVHVAQREHCLLEATSEASS
jgi:hypothetical protein